MKHIVFLFILTTSLLSIAQGQKKTEKKELQLETAVLQQYQALRPKNLSFFQWLPETDCYSYLDGYTTLMKASVRDSKAKKIITIQELNKKLDASLYWFSGFQWKDVNEFWVTDGKNYYTYNIVEEKGGKILSIPETAENAVFDPNKEQVAYTMQNNLFITTKNQENIIVTDFKDKNIVSGQAIARSEFGITDGIFWSPKGNKLAFYQKDESEVHDYPILDINTTPGTVRFIKYPMAGEKSEKPRVGIFDLKSKKTIYISPRGASDDYLTNLSWTPDEKFVLIAEVNRDQNKYTLDVYEAVTGKYIKTLFEEANDKWVEPEHAAFFPNEKSNNFVWMSEKDGFMNLYYIDFSDGTIKQLTKNKFVATNIIKAIDGKIYYSATGETPTESHLYAVDLRGNNKKITRIPGTHHVSISDDGKYIHDNFTSYDVPGKSLLLSNTGKVKKHLLEADNPLKDYQIGKADIKVLKAKDGSDLYTRLIRPSNFDPNKKYPVLIYVYGGPHAQMITNSWLAGASLWMYWMAEQGYLVFTLDNRGSANRGFAWESQIHRQCGTVEIEDQMTGVEYLKSLPYVDKERLAVHGWSYGGFMTSSLMLRQPDVFNVGVAGGPVTDWKFYEVMYGERYMDKPEENLKGYEKASLITHAHKLKGKLLLIHGTADDVVVMQHNLTLIKRFIEVKKQNVDFFVYPMHKHNVHGMDRVHLIQKVTNYIMKNNYPVKK